MFARCLCVLLCALLLSSCALFRHKHRAQQSAAPRLVGTVAVVNEALRFVLVDVGTLYTPSPGSALKSFANGQETSVLSVSPERKRPFITADIVQGEPHPGDLVYE